MCGSDIFLGILAILFPPLPVWVKRGLCSADSLINFALCMLGFVPGLIHSWYIIARYPDATYEELGQDYEPGNGERYFIVQPGSNHAKRYQRGGPAASQGYGTVQPAQGPSGQYSNQQHAVAPVSAHAGSSSAGPSDAPPPTYQEATIQGDNKVQTQH